MKVLVYDESAKQRQLVVEALEKNKHTVTVCSNSNQFMTAVTEGVAGKIVADVGSMVHGRSIYNYFDIGKKIEKASVVFYNAEEEFAGVDFRPTTDLDVILHAPLDVSAIVEAVTK